MHRPLAPFLSCASVDSVQTTRLLANQIGRRIRVQLPHALASTFAGHGMPCPAQMIGDPQPSARRCHPRRFLIDQSFSSSLSRHPASSGALVPENLTPRLLLPKVAPTLGTPPVLIAKFLHKSGNALLSPRLMSAGATTPWNLTYPRRSGLIVCFQHRIEAL